jgi:hypothetical protein
MYRGTLRSVDDRLVELLGSSTFSLPADERALGEMEDSGNVSGGIRQGFMSLLTLNAKDRGASPGSSMQVVRRPMRAVGRRMETRHLRGPQIQGSVLTPLP